MALCWFDAQDVADLTAHRIPKVSVTHLHTRAVVFGPVTVTLVNGVACTKKETEEVSSTGRGCGGAERLDESVG